MYSFDECLESFRSYNSFSYLEKMLAMRFGGSIDDNTFLRLLGHYWTQFDNLGRYFSLLNVSPFGDLEEVCYDMMNAEEIRIYESLPDLVPVYRGCYKDINEEGYSWSLDKSVAAKFPLLDCYKMSGTPVLITEELEKHRIIAVKLVFDEVEVITNPFMETFRVYESHAINADGSIGGRI